MSSGVDVASLFQKYNSELIKGGLLKARENIEEKEEGGEVNLFGEMLNR